MESLSSIQQKRSRGIQMITIDQQQKLLLNISKRLAKKITIYAIGGTAMMFLGFKDSTLDIDLVFESKEDREVFKKAIISLNYTDMNPIKVYGLKKTLLKCLN
jgi:hypothetical protein